MKHLLEPLESARSQFYFSGYQLYAKINDRPAVSLSGGASTHWPSAKPVEKDTLFDIGSVTKAVVTTTLIALGVDKNEIALDDTLGKWIEDLRGTSFEKLSLKHLLSHSAGVRWWYPVFAETKKDDLTAWMKRKSGELCETPPGQAAVYSDLGFLLLGLVIEKRWGEISAVFQKRVVEPLSLKNVKYGPVSAEESVATEFSLSEGRLLHGEVFDENARGLGGRCAQAGVFASAEGLSVWAEEWLKAWHGKSSWMSEKTARLFSSRSGLAPKSTWALGWDTKSEEVSSAGKLFSPASFGHLGYPGCSVWIDPKNEGFAILHTNRVHPSRLDERIRQLRPIIHDAMANHWAKGP